jgi:hypothetical protein
VSLAPAVRLSDGRACNEDLTIHSLPKKDHRGPPTFLYSEVVRVVASTCNEVDDDGEPGAEQPAAFVGDELVVGRALPTPERDGWLIGVSSFIDEIDEWTIWFAEDSLESTGYAEDLSQGDDDIWKWIPIGERDQSVPPGMQPTR